MRPVTPPWPASFRAKGRPPDKPLIALVATQAMAAACADFSAPAQALAQDFWPGPLTLVLPRAAASPLSPLVHQGAPGVSLRIPGNETRAQRWWRPPSGR